jgi:AraC-like DNA-binding protein
MLYFKTNIQKPIEFISGGFFVSDVPWTHSVRTIDTFEIIIGVNKCLYISQNEVDYEVHPGNVLLLLPGHTHRGYRICEEDVSFFWFHFLAGDTYELLGEEELSKELSALNQPDSPKKFSDVYIPLFFEPGRIERVNILFQQLQHVENSNYYSQLAVDYITSSLLIELSEQMITSYHISPDKSQGDRSISEMIEWIRLHALDDISTSDIAAKFTYNKDYLSRFFKKKTGFNLQEYIHLMKISKAKDMLTRSTRSIKYIAERIGIHDEKYFMRLFKRYENMTPTEYRKAFYKIHMNDH